MRVESCRPPVSRWGALKIGYGDARAAKALNRVLGKRKHSKCPRVFLIAPDGRITHISRGRMSARNKRTLLKLALASE